tara:strand:+ start:16167 stop:17450 length:1284 start_codon:yes stop_codon:yes gene_type:complete
MKKKIILKGPMMSRSGYGEQARFALRSLLSRQDIFDVYAFNIPWGQTGWIWEDNEERKMFDQLLIKTFSLPETERQFDASIQVTIPNEFEKIAPINIGYTAGIETDRIAPEWIQKSSLMDKILVVSKHSKDIYEGTGYKLEMKSGETREIKNHTPVEYINYPNRLAKPDKNFNVDFDTDFNFLVISQWGPRKNIENTVKWFVEEFRNENVGMVLKIFSMNCSTPDFHITRQNITSLVESLGDKKCKIYLLHGDLTDEQLSALYHHDKIKALVTATHGEGFGLSLFEASCAGLPVVAPDWSGHKDFLYANVKTTRKGKTQEKVRPLFTKIDYKMGDVQDNAIWEGVIPKGSKWCFPEEQSYKDSLRELYKNYGPALSRAKKLKKANVSKFTDEAMQAQFVDYILSIPGMTISEDDKEWLEELEKIEIL